MSEQKHCSTTTSTLSALTWTAFTSSLLLFAILSSVLSTLPLATADPLSLESGLSRSAPAGQGQQEQQRRASSFSLSSVSPTARHKRSRDVQQLCGYRLLDALRSVCDRNFVGFTRRSDPSFLMVQSQNDESSGEGFGPGGDNPNGVMSPWEAALTFDFPPTSQGGGGGGIGGAGGDSANLNFEEVELPMQPPPPAGGGVSPYPSSVVQWPRLSSPSGKVFAMKMLGESGRTHQRFRRNIIDECCKKPCAMNQMLKYCAITAVGKRGFNV